MQRYQNCYNSFLRKSCNPKWYEKHEDEEQTTFLGSTGLSDIN